MRNLINKYINLSTWFFAGVLLIICIFFRFFIQSNISEWKVMVLQNDSIINQIQEKVERNQKQVNSSILSLSQVSFTDTVIMNNVIVRYDTILNVDTIRKFYRNFQLPSLAYEYINSDLNYEIGFAALNKGFNKSERISPYKIITPSDIRSLFSDDFFEVAIDYKFHNKEIMVIPSDNSELEKLIEELKNRLNEN